MLTGVREAVRALRMLKGASEEEANAAAVAVDGGLPSRKRKQVSQTEQPLCLYAVMLIWTSDAQGGLCGLQTVSTSGCRFGKLVLQQHVNIGDHCILKMLELYAKVSSLISLHACNVCIR